MPLLRLRVAVTVTVIRAMMVTGTAMGEMATVLPPPVMAVMAVTVMEVRGRRVMAEAHREMVRLLHISTIKLSYGQLLSVGISVRSKQCSQLHFTFSTHVLSLT